MISYLLISAMYFSNSLSTPDLYKAYSSEKEVRESFVRQKNEATNLVTADRSEKGRRVLCFSLSRGYNYKATSVYFFYKVNQAVVPYGIYECGSMSVPEISIDSNLVTTVTLAKANLAIKKDNAEKVNISMSKEVVCILGYPRRNDYSTEIKE